MKTLEIINPQALPDKDFLKSQTRYILFDFDGTLSTLRQGWEGIMAPFMMEMICGQAELTLEQRAAIEKEVNDYIDFSTGILTIKQMMWLEEAVKRQGLAEKNFSAKEYKAMYLEKIMGLIGRRLAMMKSGEKTKEDFLVPGVLDFLKKLKEEGFFMCVASGTDQKYVSDETIELGLADFFGGRIYGALDDDEAHEKSLIIKRILEEHKLSGNNLLVIGDGPVEMREAKNCGAWALGVASEELLREGWNERKRQRLIKAGADLLIPDYKSFKEWWD